MWRPGWRRLLPVAVWGTVSLLSLAVLASLLVVLLYDEVALDLHHSNAVGQVVRVNNGSRGPGSVQVEFSAGGTPAKAWVGLPWFGEHPDRGDSVRIEYLDSNPGTARFAGAHDVVTLGVGVAGLVLITVAAGWFERHRRGRRRSR